MNPYKISFSFCQFNDKTCNFKRGIKTAFRLLLPMKLVYHLDFFKIHLHFGGIVGCLLKFGKFDRINGIFTRTGRVDNQFQPLCMSTCRCQSQSYTYYMQWLQCMTVYSPSLNKIMAAIDSLKSRFWVCHLWWWIRIFVVLTRSHQVAP